MKNKNIFLSVARVATLAVGLSIASCQVTDLDPQNALSESTAFTTPERIELAVAGVYDAAQSGFYAGGAVRGYPLGAAHCQQGDMRGEDMTLAGGAVFYAITYQATYDPTTANNGFMWQSLYGVINKANIVIEGIKTTKPSNVLTQAQLNAYEAECRFMRAVAHHFLLVNWARPFSDNPTAAAGGVPYRTTAINGGSSVDVAIAQGRNTVTECYAKMIEDLDFADANLPVTRAGGRGITRATKAAAIAMKTRIYLHQNNFAKVIEEGNKIAAQTSAPFTSTIGSYRLATDPMGAFGSNNKSNTESMFSVENNDVDNGGANGALSAMYGAATLGGRGIVAISPLLWNQAFWLPNDLRRNTTTSVVADPAGRFSRKYADITGRTDNAPIIRYSEVLLNMAEAAMRSGNSVDSRALNLLNAVRNRAVTTPADQFSASSFASANDMFQAIIQERRIEFAAEGLRWLDIHRLAQNPVVGTAGIPAKLNNSINFTTLYTGNPATITTAQMLGAIPYADARFLWPIPTEEIVNNPTLAKQQNPGW